MVKKKIKQINIFDFLVAIIVILVVFIVLIPQKNTESTNNLLLSVKTNQIVAYEEALREKEVYLDSLNKPVKVVKVSKINEPGKEVLEIVLEAPGRVEADRYIFNGLRVQVGQKAELRGKYFVQGFITEIKNANK